MCALGSGIPAGLQNQRLRAREFDSLCVRQLYIPRTNTPGYLFYMKLTLNEIWNHCDNNGHAYFIEHYCHRRDLHTIEDKQLREEALKAEEALRKFKERLKYLTKDLEKKEDV